MENVNCFFEEYGPNKRARTFRIEFNPNEAPAEWMPYYQAHILPCLTDVGFTRIDIAVDTNVNLSGYYLDTIVPLKTNTWRGRNKALKQSISVALIPLSAYESTTRKSTCMTRRKWKLPNLFYGVLNRN